MGDDPRQHFDPEEDSYEWDLEREPRPRILWGRVVILAALLVLAFLLGRTTARGGASEGELRRANEKLTEARAEVRRLQNRLTGQPEDTGDNPEETESPAGNDEEAEEGKTYTVKAGDTLRGIAQRFYGDVSLDDYIADANGITNPEQLTVGQELTIPREPDR